jgi:hypothetical protein
MFRLLVLVIEYIIPIKIQGSTKNKFFQWIKSFKYNAKSRWICESTTDSLKALESGRKH